MDTVIDIRPDDLTGSETLALIGAHLAGMSELSPPESVHALDVRGLQDPAVSFWSAWVDGTLAGIGALKTIDAARGEIKSMRVDDAFLGRGIGRAILRHIVREARSRGMWSLWLETGSTDEFLPARRLYASEGFVECGPFPPYVLDPYSVFMTREIDAA